MPLPSFAEVIRVHSALGSLIAGQRYAGPAPFNGRMPVLIHSQVPWDSVWQRPQELAMGLSAHRPVLYFSPVQVHEALTRIGARWQPIRSKNEDRLVIYSPIIFSGEYRMGISRGINEHLVVKTLRRMLAPGSFIYLTNAVFSDTLHQRVVARFVGVDIIDDFSAFDWAPPGARMAESHLLKRADFVIAGTGAMQRKFAEQRPDIEYLPSGTHPEKYAAQSAEPEDLRSLPHPRILYIGTLNDRMNPKLFMEASRAVPNGSVVLVGPAHGSFSLPGPKPANLHMLGLKPHDQLPGYYAHCDLGIMPFADSAAARAINPVKALEFLAAGVPVLSTPIPDVVAEFSGVIRVAEPEAWPQALREELARPSSPEDIERRRAHVRTRTWSVLVDAVEERLRRVEETIR